MKSNRRIPLSGQANPKPKRLPARVASRNWWPYAIAGGVLVLIVAFIAVMQLGRASSGPGVAGGGLAIGSPVPTNSVPSSSGSNASLGDFRGSKVVVYFYEGGG
jgi:hypothetical protein